MSEILKEMSNIGIIPVVALNDAKDAAPLAKALIDGGIPCAEVTFRTDAAEESIRIMATEYPEMLVGAGTVLTIEQVDRAVNAGAKFIVSPGLNPKVVKYCVDNNILVIPGCTNPSDVEVAIELGLETVKFFPAEPAGGLPMIKAMSAPYTKMKFMPTGGINENNLKGYLDFSKIVACGGSWMVKNDLIEAGKEVIQETRRWDDTKEYSYAMRSKEDAQDYRYFPDPDLVPVIISEEWLQEVKSREPEFRDEKMARYIEEFELPEYDADIITQYKPLADLFEETVALGNKPKEVSNWIMGETMRLCKEESIDPDQIKFSAANLSKLIKLIEDSVINRGAAKEVFEEMFKSDVDPEKYVEEHGMKQDNDEDALREIVKKVIEENPKAVEDVRSGKGKAIGALVGQTMKATQGKANPGVVNKLLKELI